MALRVRFYMTWTIALVPGFEGAPFSKLDDFYALARAHLVTRFENYNAEMKITVRENYDTVAILDIVWDVDLDGIAGPWHMPEDHARLAQAELVEKVSGYGRKLTVDIYREADPEEVQDHAEMMVTAAQNGITLEAGDYPVFRPEQHADWPEANEVFLQEGVWWWCAPGDAMDPEVSTGPAVGPDPVKIYTPWDPDYRERRYAKFVAKVA